MARILVVDDYPDLCRLLVRLLDYAGHETTCITRSQDVPDFLGRTTPDLIVLDAVLAGVGGLELLGQIRANPATRGVPVLMYSAYDDDGLRGRALALGAQAYVVKNPAGFEALAAMVPRLVRLARPGTGGRR